MKPDIAPFGSPALRLRLLKPSDLDMTLAWRNRDDARVWFKTSTLLSQEQHRAWFTHYSDKDDDLIFILESQGHAVGQASVYGIDRAQAQAEIGRFLVAPEHSGRGHIRHACGELIRFCTQELGLQYLFLEVLENNLRAIGIYNSHGFQEESRHHGLIRMGLHLQPSGAA